LSTTIGRAVAVDVDMKYVHISREVRTAIYAHGEKSGMVERLFAIHQASEAAMYIFHIAGSNHLKAAFDNTKVAPPGLYRNQLRASERFCLTHA